MSIIDSASNSFNLTKPLTKLVNMGCSVVGGVYSLNFHTATVLTDDFKKRASGGIPEGGFLLAAAGTPSAGGFLLDDQEVVLLRVRGTASLPHERELTQLRLAVVRDAGATGQGFNAVQDPLTRDELQQSAFECDVLGTFYTKDDSPGAEVFFGSDIDNVMVSARYQVYLPSKEVLSWIASFPNQDADGAAKLEIGKVRFSATQRKAVVAKTDQAPVLVHVDDFIGRKTAVFGMTRAGKSNTIKTLVTATHQYASERGEKIGQLVFDPQGEYANENEQDNTGLHLLGDDDSTVRVYKVGPDPARSKEKPLCFNFYDPAILDVVWNIITDTTRDLEAAYVTSFRAAKLEQPDENDRSALSRWTWTVTGLYALLYECGFTGNRLATTVRVSLSKAQYEEFDKAHPGDVTRWTSNGGGWGFINSPAVAYRLAAFAAARTGSGALFEKWGDNQSSFKEVWKAVDAGSGSRLHAALKSIRDFHDTGASGDVAQNVWDDMEAGRLVIVDLSIGSEAVTKLMSERIVTGLLNRSNDRFRRRAPLVRYQVIVEEAHNLFERGGQKRSVKDDPWVRLSKEAAKYKVGLMYATQEVTSVDERILSNTSNWLIAHLNNDTQTKELAHYYDFGVWSKSLIRSEEVGFVRMKTYSGKYIVPTQVAKFDHDMINRARKAARLEPIDPPYVQPVDDLPADSAPFDLFSDAD